VDPGMKLTDNDYPSFQGLVYLGRDGYAEIRFGQLEKLEYYNHDFR
jgi:hypothetical protein